MTPAPLSLGKLTPVRRAVLVALVAIISPALLLFYLGLQTLQRQEETMVNLQAQNLALSAESLAAELEQRAGQLAEACLSDERLARAAVVAGTRPTLETVLELRALTAELGPSCPLADDFFVLHDGVVRFPLVHELPPRRLDDYLAGEPPEVRGHFAEVFGRAEMLELRQHRPALAVQAYRDSYELEVSPALKALALARVARSWQKMQREADVRTAYQQLGQQLGDQYDPFNRPYALVAAVELGATETGITSTPALVRSAYTRLLGGAWELSGGQLRFFLDQLEARLGRGPGERAASETLRRSEFAIALQEGFTHHGPLRAKQVYGLGFGGSPTDYQVYYYAVDSGTEQETLVGLGVNAGWLAQSLLPSTADDLSLASDLEFELGYATGNASADESVQQAAFPSIYPQRALHVRLSPGAAARASGQRDTMIFGASMGLILAVLGLGVFLLIRDASREMQLAQVRADFVSGVSHELRTPLTLIRLYGETLVDEADLKEEERRDYSQVIARESERLTHLIDNVLDFAHIDRGRKQYDVRDGDLRTCVRRAVEAYGRYLKHRGFAIDIELQHDLPPVRFDPNAVAQALVNLIDNAVKYSDEDRYVAVRLFVSETQVIVEVEDRGAGIAADELGQIFDPFYRSQRPRGKGGHGLGLYLVQHIMEAHAGSIEVDSELGNGSVFRLVFPVSSSGGAGDETDAETEE